MSKARPTSRSFLLLLACITLALVAVYFLARRASAAPGGEASANALSMRRAKDEVEDQVEAALYTRAEFFGAQALVPYPTAEARNRLAEVARKYPREPRVHLRLARLDEELGQFNLAEQEMQNYVAAGHETPDALDELSRFFHRRARFEDEAATLERELRVVPVEGRAAVLRQLAELARVHKLERYLSPDFYAQLAARNDSTFEIVSQYIEKLVEVKNYEAALRAVREHKGNFPSRRSYFLNEETTVLDNMGNEREAEKVYREAFDPFWPDDVSGGFYDYLKDHDRYRAYGDEQRKAFRRDPSDYDAAVRLFHFEKDSYGEDAPNIFTKLEKARAARGVQWKAEELATVARLLLREGDGNAASRFLYTLYAQGNLEKGNPLRAKVLYQLFELLTDAEDRRLALTRGDLKFYEDVATADPHPGIIGGVLSLILSDTNPRAGFDEEEAVAVKYFNRAAAYRVFSAYKQEYPTSPELAQMYLDIVRLYTATKEPGVAAGALAEFEQRYADAPQYPEVALKLADACVATGQPEREREIYQRILDYFGKNRRPGTALIPAAQAPADATDDDGGREIVAPLSEPTASNPVIVEYVAKSNPGVTIPGETGETQAWYGSYETQLYSDHMGARGSQANTSDEKQAGAEVTYASVLARYVASLANDKRTEDILALYANEVRKHPDEQGLYEQMLQWLGQTNLVEEQLRVYRETLRRFPTALWRDRLARWFLRRSRGEEFEAYSRELLEKMNDDEAEAYLGNFVAAGASGSAGSFDARLYLGLYTLAHERFPHNLNFVDGLLRYYGGHAQWREWQSLVAEYYFVSPGIRAQFLSRLASQSELRGRLGEARVKCGDVGAGVEHDGLDALPYKLFRADAAVWLSNYEEAIDAYRELNRLYPNTPEFSERLVAFTRSLGQRNRNFLEEAASVQQSLADSFPASADYRTRAGEIFAELGDYTRAGGEWEQLIAQGRDEPENYLDAATLYWDYFQYERALATIKSLREGAKARTLYAFQSGAIDESLHRMPEALAEYAKAIDEDAPEYVRAKKRLTALFKRPGIPAQFRLAFEKERRGRTDDSALVLGYAELLKGAGQWDSASNLLKAEVARNDSQSFLQRAREMFSENEESGGERAALERLAAVAKAGRFRISYRLQLADSYAQAGEQSAAAVIKQLVREYPANYGVLSETANFYWRMGRRQECVSLLRQSAAHAKGKFHYVFARRLAARLTDLKRLSEAGAVLAALHLEDKLDLSVFHELARVYLRTGDHAALGATFRQTLDALKGQDVDIKELRGQIAELRGEMIGAFTQLKDYKSAIEQHIEIINRDPEDEEKLDAAIAYAVRHGGADELLNYYLRTSRQAYKNYRWNVVLARIYEARGDLDGAAANYRAALDNQPEMLELYDALAGVYTRTKNYDAALAALGKACELSNDDPQYVRREIEVFEKAGRGREAEAARMKLPAAAPTPRTSVKDQFEEASRLRRMEREKAIETYRQAFDAFAAAPLKNELQAAQITGYVQTVRGAEGLDKLTTRLWSLRAKLIQEAERENSKHAGHARSLLQTLDGALPEAVGGVARDVATGDELSSLYQFLQKQIDESLRDRDRHGTLGLLQNISRRAGFGALEEKILVAQKDEAFGADDKSNYHARLKSLVDF
ncbi:MAG: hypothetical protein LC754_05480, partial [Acidobacteria bacterium]|nr:hypothetical protein [Acidobacteriota bacterium]